MPILCGPALAFVGHCGPLLTCVGRRWLLWAFVGFVVINKMYITKKNIPIPFLSSWACIGLCWVLWACVDLRWPSLVSVCHSGSADSFLCMSIFIFRLWLKTVQILKIRFEHMT